jgi:hypothetical protein
MTLLLLDAFLKHAGQAGTPLMQTLLRTELLAAMTTADKAEAARAVMTSICLHHALHINLMGITSR